MFNVLGVSLSLGMLQIPSEKLTESINSIFSKKKSIAEINVAAANFAYNFASAKFENSQFNFPSKQISEETMLVQGHYGTSIGKIIAGCRFQSYYPITPATDESDFLERNEILAINEDRPGSTLVVQTEDEISAIGMAIGSSLTGTRSSTCTSGPGFSLMAESLSWAGINEIPLVITLYQRSGPSTGLPTRTQQGDIAMLYDASHGDTQHIVLIPGNVDECFDFGWKAFDYAEKYQTMVFGFTDLDLGMNLWVSSGFKYPNEPMNRGKVIRTKEELENLLEENGLFDPYDLDHSWDTRTLEVSINGEYYGVEYYKGLDDYLEYMGDVICPENDEEWYEWIETFG